MRKRLRKKLRVGEFDVAIVPIAFELPGDTPLSQVNELADGFIAVIESNGLAFGGGGGTSWQGFAESEHRWSRPRAAQAQAIRDWLAAQPLVLRFWVGPPMKSAEVDMHLRRDPDFRMSMASETVQHASGGETQ